MRNKYRQTRARNSRIADGDAVVELSVWREELYRKGVLDRNAKSPREEFNRVRQELQARGLIGIRDDLAWKAQSRQNVVISESTNTELTLPDNNLGERGSSWPVPPCLARRR
jgi:hypothetical protein